MRLIGILLLLCLCAVAARVLMWAFLIVLLWGVLTHPGRTFGFVAFLVIAKLAESHPAIIGTTLLILAIVAQLSSPKNDFN